MKMKKTNGKMKSSVSPNFEEDDFIDDDMCSTDGSGHPPVQRNTANARERARMRVLSSAFYRLKTIIPWVPHDTKLSKLDTLRLAKNYISYLMATLDGQPVEEITNKMPHPQKTTWPYIFQQVPELNKKKTSTTVRKPEQSQSPPSINYPHHFHSMSSQKHPFDQPVYVPAIQNRNLYSNQLPNESVMLFYN